jgi:hypothetical protein
MNRATSLFKRDDGAPTHRYFAAIIPNNGIRFLDLDSFEVGSEPSGYHALFQDWEVSISWPGQREMITLVKSAATTLHGPEATARK